MTFTDAGRIVNCSPQTRRAPEFFVAFMGMTEEKGCFLTAQIGFLNQFFLSKHTITPARFACAGVIA